MAHLIMASVRLLLVSGNRPNMSGWPHTVWSANLARLWSDWVTAEANAPYGMLTSKQMSPKIAYMA
jgi:hypothetical protein